MQLYSILITYFFLVEVILGVRLIFTLIRIPSAIAISDHPSEQQQVAVAEIARRITVRLLSQDNGGSGVIIQKHGQNYLVLTNNHVVADSDGQQLEVLTSDGRKHQGKWLRSADFGSTDLALVEFKSSQAYRVAELEKLAPIRVGEQVYAAGFPLQSAWTVNSRINTRAWGLETYKITTGSVEMILRDRSLHRGYRLGYTNDVTSGMSGGPLLNAQGKLIGVNGRLKYPFDGLVQFAFTDGSLPSSKLFQEMEALSWAIPIDAFSERMP
jgi:S1-C subfamily serine protease